jgi:tRNA pseudouridine38-40 synthase
MGPDIAPALSSHDAWAARTERRSKIMRCTYRVELAYDGSGFHGFRRLAGRRTVESVLLDSLARLLPEVSSLAVGGQTDSGVHALGQVVSFYGRVVELPALFLELSRAAPSELTLLGVSRVERRFHARSCARSRCYRYRLPAELDLELLQAMLERLSEAPSLDAFARDTDGRGAKLERAVVVQKGGASFIEVSAARFLRRQIRVMAATALRSLERREHEDALLRLALLGDRSATAAPAPAGDLALVNIAYDDFCESERVASASEAPASLFQRFGLPPQ